MKKSFLSFVLLLFCFTVFAAAPTASSSNLTFNTIEGKGFTGAFTAGNGTYRLIVIKEGSAVTGLPQAGKQYNANSNFGGAGSEFGPAGEYVVATTSWSSFTVYNLKPATVYYVAIFEYNGTNASCEYLMLPLTGNRMTAVAPTTQAVMNASFSATGNTLGIGWAGGNGAGRLVLARKGAPVNATPADLTYYFAEDVFETGNKVGTDNYAVYRGAGPGVLVKNLEPNTTYHFAAFEYNGSNSPVYLAPGAITSFTTAAGPSVAPSGVSFGSVEGNRMTIAFSTGNGTRRLIIARKNAAVTAVPVNGTAYTGATFGVGSEIQPGEFVVANVNGYNAVITGLEPATTYHFRVFEFDMDKAGNTYYLTTSFASKSGSTATSPSVLASNLRISSNTGTSATIGFTPGNGSYRVLVMKEGSAVDAAPQHFTTYSGSSNFGAGTPLGNGNFASHWSTNGNSMTVGALLPGKTYHVSLHEFNGYNYPVYSASAPFSFTMPLQPTLAASNLTAGYAEAGQMRLTWTSGNGTKRVVIARKGSYVTAVPADGVTYTAKASFGQGQEIAAGEFVVYNGSSNYCDVTNLELATTYHFAVFEYNSNEAGEPDYLTAHPVASGTTVGYPAKQLTLLAAGNIQSTSATLNFTKGSGENRVFFMSETDMAGFLPADYVKYSNNTYGTSASHVGSGVYCVNNTSGTGSFGVTNLKPNTKYYVRAFEYNGVNSPAYLRTPVPAISFTTADVPGATVPTMPAINGESDNADGNKLTLKWTKGNGQKRIVVMRKAAGVTFVPSDATAYNANPAFSNGTDLGGGQYVVYNGNGTSIDITNLQPSETYFVMVYEYNGSDALLRYLTSAKLAFTGSTVFAPGTPVSNVNAVAGSGSFTLNWTPGDGAGRLVVMKEGSAPTAQPADLSVYPANSVFKNGSQMATGEYVIYAGTGNSVTITGLANSTYHYAIYEYNGNSAPVYNTANAVRGSAVVSSTLPVSLTAFTAKAAGDAVELKWATVQETNSSHFVVERSADASRYEVVTTVQAAGSSAARKEYSYTDAVNTDAEKIYYRLKQVDRDGQFTYSSVQAVEKKKSGGIAIYPNPVVAFFRIALPKGVKGVQLTVYDMKGSIAMSRKVKEGEMIDASGLVKGTYLLMVEYNGTTSHSKLLKQ